MTSPTHVSLLRHKMVISQYVAATYPICISCSFPCWCMTFSLLQHFGPDIDPPSPPLHSKVRGSCFTQFNLYAPCILYIGQTYRYSPDRHHASYIQDRRAATSQIGTMHPIYRTDVPLLRRQAPCILYIGQTYRYSPDRHHACYIQDRLTVTPHSTLFIYLVNKYI